MVDNPGISARCQSGFHGATKGIKPARGRCLGWRDGKLLCACQCHVAQPMPATHAIVKIARPKGAGKAKMVPIHEIGCSKKPCVCSDIRAGKAAKKIVTGLAKLFVEALFKPAEGTKQDSGKASKDDAKGY